MPETDLKPESDASETRPFRTNPVEIVILLAIGLVLCNSVYNLFYGTDGFRPSALKAMAANPISEGRSPASVSSSFLNAEVGCDANTEKTTSASKVRITGPLCGLDPAIAPDQLARATVLNETNRFSATVFTDTSSSRFSTDYIPLTAGKNEIKVEFAFRSGLTRTQEVAITKY